MINKTRLLWTSLLLALVTMSAAQAALPTSVGGQAVTSLAPLVESASPAVVNIRITQMRRDRYGRTGEVGGAGSGVIVDAENGYILTNHHVVDGADEIQSRDSSTQPPFSDSCPGSYVHSSWGGQGPGPGARRM